MSTSSGSSLSRTQRGSGCRRLGKSVHPFPGLRGFVAGISSPFSPSTQPHVAFPRLSSESDQGPLDGAKQRPRPGQYVAVPETHLQRGQARRAHAPGPRGVRQGPRLCRAPPAGPAAPDRPAPASLMSGERTGVPEPSMTYRRPHELAPTFREWKQSACSTAAEAALRATP